MSVDNRDLNIFVQDEYKAILLNQRELTGEEIVAKIMDFVEKHLPVELSADERRQALFRGVMDKLNELSASLQIRLGPILGCVAAGNVWFLTFFFLCYM